MSVYYSTGRRVSQYQFRAAADSALTTKPPKKFVKLCKEIYCILLYKCYNKDVLRGVTFMAQVMVNFRMDENVKKSMEQACREMGLSMTTAFTIYATKVGREKRIPFEITAESPRCQPCPSDLPEHREENPPAQKREQLEALCGEIRRSLTAIHTAIPSSVTGLSMERIRLLCSDELKDKAAGVSAAVRTLFSGRNAGALKEKDPDILNEYLDGLADIAREIRNVEGALIPAMKSWTGGDTSDFVPYEQRLAAVSREFDGLTPVLQRFWASTVRKQGSARAVQARLRQSAASVETAYVRTALENLEALVLRHYESLDGQTKARLETHYFQTLDLTLRELIRAERNGEAPGGKAALCLRTINVLSQVISDGGRTRRELDQRSLEAEVAALERLAALRGDLPGDMRADS